MILITIQLNSLIHGVDPKLVEAIIQTESSFRPYVTGSAGEVGLMQMKPHLFLPGPLNLYDPQINIAIGTRELSKLKRLRPRLGQYWFTAWNMGAMGALRYSNVGDISSFVYAKKVSSIIRKQKFTFYKNNQINPYQNSTHSL